MYTDAQLMAMSPEDRAKAWSQMSEGDRQKALAEREARRGAAAPTTTSPEGGLIDTAWDMAKAGGAGFARGVVGLAGLPGTLSDLTDQGLTNLGKMTGVIPDDWQAPNASQLSSGSLLDLMSDATGGASDFRGETRAGKYAGTIGEFAPGGPLKSAPAFLARTVLPAVMSETAGWATEGTKYEPWARLGGALATPFVLEGARSLITPHGGVSDERLGLVKVLDDAGVPVTAGQKVGDKGLQRTEAIYGQNMLDGEAQQKAFTRAALKTAGIDADLASPDVLRKAADDLGNEFDRILGNTSVTPTATDVAKLKLAGDEYRALAPTTSHAPVIDDVVTAVQTAMKNGQTIPAETVKVWRSRLSKLVTSPSPETRAAASEALTVVSDMIDNALVAAGRPDDVSALALAREQWRNFLAIQNTAASAAPGAGMGYLSPAQLRNAVKAQGTSAYAQGKRGDLGELARAGKEILPPPGTSGTAENLRVMGLPTAAGGGAGAALGAALGGPIGAFGGSMLGAMAPRAIGVMKTSPPGQLYLGNQLVRRTPSGGFVPSTVQAAKPFITGAETQGPNLMDFMKGPQ